MSLLEHLYLVGEYPKRARLLSGLTLEQVTQRPSGVTHSIYEELWHIVAYQQTVAAGADPNGPRFPSEEPQDVREWKELVQTFLDGARAVVALSEEPERLAPELEPGLTLGEELQCVALHNAYHFGKIVALRQRLGAWPPEAAAGDA